MKGDIKTHEPLVCDVILINTNPEAQFHPCHVLTSFLWFQEPHSQTRNVSVQTMNTCLTFQPLKNKAAKGRRARAACKLAVYRDERKGGAGFDESGTHPPGGESTDTRSSTRRSSQEEEVKGSQKGQFF